MSINAVTGGRTAILDAMRTVETAARGYATKLDVHKGALDDLLKQEPEVKAQLRGGGSAAVVGVDELARSAAMFSESGKAARQGALELTHAVDGLRLLLSEEAPAAHPAARALVDDVVAVRGGVSGVKVKGTWHNLHRNPGPAAFAGALGVGGPAGAAVAALSEAGTLGSNAFLGGIFVAMGAVAAVGTKNTTTQHALKYTRSFAEALEAALLAGSPGSKYVGAATVESFIGSGRVASERLASESKALHRFAASAQERTANAVDDVGLAGKGALTAEQLARYKADAAADVAALVGHADADRAALASPQAAPSPVIAGEAPAPEPAKLHVV